MWGLFGICCAPLLAGLQFYEVQGVRSDKSKSVHEIESSHGTLTHEKHSDDEFDFDVDHGTPLEHLKQTGVTLGEASSDSKIKDSDEKRTAANRFMSPKESVVSRIISSLERQGAGVAQFLTHLRQHFVKMLVGRDHRHYHP
jgi:hypothetical protein